MSVRTILVIDYDPQSIQSTMGLLVGAGYRVEVAQDGVEGLKAFERLQPDLVLIEPMVPKKHGFQVCQEIKDTPRGKSTPVLITTAFYRGRRHKSEAKEYYGCDGYLEKPVADELLLSTCRKFLIDTQEPPLPVPADEPAAAAVEPAPAAETPASASTSADPARPSGTTGPRGPELPALEDLSDDEIMARLDALIDEPPTAGPAAEKSKAGVRGPSPAPKDETGIPSPAADARPDRSPVTPASAAAPNDAPVPADAIPLAAVSAAAAPVVEPTTTPHAATAPGAGATPSIPLTSAGGKAPARSQTRTAPTAVAVPAVPGRAVPTRAAAAPAAHQPVVRRRPVETRSPSPSPSSSGRARAARPQAARRSTAEADRRGIPRWIVGSGLAALVLIVSGSAILWLQGDAAPSTLGGPVAVRGPVELLPSGPPAVDTVPDGATLPENRGAQTAPTAPDNSVPSSPPVTVESPQSAANTPRPEPQATTPAGSPVSDGTEPASRPSEEPRPEPAADAASPSRAAPPSRPSHDPAVSPATPRPSAPERAEPSRQAESTIRDAAVPPPGEAAASEPAVPTMPLASEDGGAEGAADLPPFLRRVTAARPEPVTLPATPPPVPRARRGDLVKLDDVDSPPVSRVKAPPDYPAIARKQRLEGTVVMSLLVDEQGNVDDVEIVEGTDARVLDGAAIRAAKAWSYRPAMKDGVPVKVRLVERVVFKL